MKSDGIRAAIYLRVSRDDGDGFLRVSGPLWQMGFPHGVNFGLGAGGDVPSGWCQWLLHPL